MQVFICTVKNSLIYFYYHQQKQSISLNSLLSLFCYCFQVNRYQYSYNKNFIINLIDLDYNKNSHNIAMKYLDIVCEMLELYQKQFIKLLRKYSHENIPQFKALFDIHFKKLKEAELAKSIQDSKASDICESMNDFLQASLRVKKTSQSDRYDIRPRLFSQQENRFRFTGMTGVRPLEKEPKNQVKLDTFKIEEIAKSYRIEDQSKPKMRMKWKSFNAGERSPQGKQKQKATIGSNNIDLLSYTIPEIQNSIRRLSVPNRNSYQFDMYRTVDTRQYNTRKKVVRRLF